MQMAWMVLPRPMSSARSKRPFLEIAKLGKIERESESGNGLLSGNQDEHKSWPSLQCGSPGSDLPSSVNLDFLPYSSSKWATLTNLSKLGSSWTEWFSPVLRDFDFLWEVVSRPYSYLKHILSMILLTMCSRVHSGWAKKLLLKTIAI